MICPSCKTKNQYYHRYCYYCGCKLDAFKSTAQPSKLEKDHNPVQAEDEYLYKKIKALEHQEQELKEFHSYSGTNDEVKDTYENISKEDDIEEIDLQEDSLEEVDLRENDIEEYNLEKSDLEEKDEKEVDPLSNSQQSLYDYLFDYNKSDDFDITQEIPLRRYRKSRAKSAHKAPKVLISLIMIGLLVFAVFVLVKEISSSALKQVNNSQTIVVSTVVKPTDKDGNPAHQIIFNTTNGKEVKILNNTIPVEDGRAELILEDSFLYSLDPIENEEGILEVRLDSTISAPGFPDVNETVSIPLNQPYASITLIQPSSTEAIVEGDSFQLVLSVEPGSKVFINDNDYTDLTTAEGKLVKEISFPLEEDEAHIMIRVSRQGFVDNIQEIVLKRPVMEVPIVINETSPIPSEGQWVKISGTTIPGASISTDSQTKEPPAVDPETGEFTIHVRAPYPGYTPCNLIAKLEDKSSSVEMILDGETNVDRYTSTAWKPEYNELRQNPDLHNGQHFLFKGTIQDILVTGYKNVFTVDVSTNSDSKQLIHVEYWGNDFNLNQGDRIRIFGNRWGNIGDMPRILAKYIYSN